MRLFSAQVIGHAAADEMQQELVASLKPGKHRSWRQRTFQLASWPLRSRDPEKARGMCAAQISSSLRRCHPGPRAPGPGPRCRARPPSAQKGEGA